MEQEQGLTRRDALRGMASVAAAAMLPGTADAEGAAKGASPWPADAVTNPMRAQAFNDDWRFHRGDVPGAEAESFDDHSGARSTCRTTGALKTCPRRTTGKGAVWSGGTTPLRAGPFDMYASEGQIATGWTVGGIGWYRKTFDNPQSRPEAKRSSASKAST